MDPIIVRARELIRHLEHASETMSMYEDNKASYKIEREKTGRGDERVVIRCVTNVMEELGNAPDGLLGSEPSEERVDLRGTSWSIGVPEILSFLESLNKSGTLVVSTFTETFSIVLENGQVVHASTDESPMGLRLGDILVQQGATTPETLRHFLKAHSTDPSCMGEAAVVDEVVSKEDLRTALAFQIQQLFHRIFDAKDATFTFYDGNTNSPRVSVRMNLTLLLLESAGGAEERAAKA